MRAFLINRNHPLMTLLVTYRSSFREFNSGFVEGNHLKQNLTNASYGCLMFLVGLFVVGILRLVVFTF